jgi:hypothetical protein
VKGLKRDDGDFLELSETFVQAFAGFLRRTLSSNLILDSVKTRRFLICINAADTMDAILKILREDEEGRLTLPRSIEIGQALARWCTNENRQIAYRAKRIVVEVLMAVTEHDDHWIGLAKDQFGIPEHVLRDNIAHGDNSVLLFIFTHLTRQAIHTPYNYTVE